MNLALFDFDGTVTSSDTWTPFMRFAVRPSRMPAWVPLSLKSEALSLSPPLPYGVLQTKFAASWVLPTPVYCATCGYGQSGRVMSTLLLVTCEAAIRSGATPDSRQRSNTPTYLI